MCLNLIDNTLVSDGTVTCWKVFEYDIHQNKLTSPFYHFPLEPECYADEDRALYKAKRDLSMIKDRVEDSSNELLMLLESERNKPSLRFDPDSDESVFDKIFSENEIDLIFNKTAQIADSCEYGFVHSYLTKNIAIQEVENYYSYVHPTILIKCTVPNGEIYHTGGFDSDRRMKCIATKCLKLESVEMFSLSRWMLKAEDICKQPGYVGERTLQKDMEWLDETFDKVVMSERGTLTFNEATGITALDYDINNDY